MTDNRLLDYLNGKKLNKEEKIEVSKQVERIIKDKVEKIVIKETTQLPLMTEEEKTIKLDRNSLFSDVPIRLLESLEVDNVTVKSIIKDYIAGKLELEKVKFKSGDTLFEDYGRNKKTLYHIFIVLDQKMIDENILKDVFVRLRLSQEFYEKQNIVLYSILDGKLYIFETTIEKDILNFLGGNKCI